MKEFLSVNVSIALPKLAWMAKVENSGVSLACGAGVAIDKYHASEGAWFGEEYVFGSIVRPIDNGLECIPPSHTCEGLYIVFPFNKEFSYVTNSLVWALKKSGVLDSRSLSMVAAPLKTASKGVASYSKEILTTKSASVVRVLYNKFRVSPRGVQEGFSLASNPSLDFLGYKKIMLSVLKNVFEKASENGFNKKVSSISSGYDSVAASALGKELGVENYITLKTSTNDSGASVGKQMGLSVREFERPGDGFQYRSNGAYYVDLQAAQESAGEDFDEFLSCLVNPGDLVMSPFRKELRGAVFLSGFHGDKVWDFYCNSGPWVKRGDSSGSALGEFRLSEGFVHIPVPFIFCNNSFSLKRLTQSAEMKPWSYNNPYNRPIPRRLGEESGAIRDSFGVKKMAANFGIRIPEGSVFGAYERVADRYGDYF